ncbi:YafY family transcriptional regulator [Rossellomorea vietnamensis]|uniref:YafY family transcriptional regulator n=1 Tax=Rossellomorea vietnamensis TaxID=218284 RepID=A0ACD4CD18_9BACI|nr:YafY family protein [Rossellomorea vietnamensis]UXH46589.1 YafY family transcriptional regulator [Rossellomorea vietnamensis]
MRGDRLVSILLLLQAHGRMTAKELAEKLEVSERTIHRDMDALSGTGIPVVAERGQNGGWSLLEDYRTDLTGLKESEIRALFVSPSLHLLDDLGLTRTTEEARNKLIASLPSIVREKAKDVWNRIHIDTSSWRKQKDKTASLEMIKGAIFQETKLAITYERADGEIDDRVVEPLGLVAKGELWYLVAAKENGDIRNYRVSRIHHAEKVDETFQRPDGFDLAHYWSSSTTSFIKTLPSFEVKVEVAPQTLSRLTFTGRFARVLEVGERRGAEWIPVTLSFDTEEEAKGYMIGFTDQVKIVEPADLKQKVLEMAEATVSFYRQME